MKGKWLKYERETRLAGFLIVAVLMVMNLTALYLLNYIRKNYDLLLRSKIDFVAHAVEQKFSMNGSLNSPEMLKQIREVADSANLKGIGIISNNGNWEFSTNDYRIGDMFQRPGTTADLYIDNIRHNPGKPFKVGNSWYISYIYGRKGGRDNLVLIAPADYQEAMALGSKILNYALLIIGGLVFIFLYFYLNSVFAPFRVMAKTAREQMSSNDASFDSDTDFVMDIYHKMIWELKDKGNQLSELYDNEKVRADNIEHYSRQVLDSIDKAILTINRRGELISYNKYAVSILGEHGAEKIVGMIADLNNQSVVISEWETPQGSRMILQIDVSEYKGTNGDGGGYIVMISDITEIKRNEELAGYAERAELLRNAAQGFWTRIQPALERLRDGFRGTFSGETAQEDLNEIENCVKDFGSVFSLGKGREDKEISSEIIHESVKMKEVICLVEKVASSDSTVLITGESGTGKELVAKEIHRLSPRGDGEFIALNCAALPESLLESELFGYVKGAFTGANRDKPGLFKIADKGTFFLDEISELSLPLQAKILRVIQEREVVPVGGTKPLKVDVRLISATNRDLEDLVNKGLFRQDLYYRINVFPIRVPSLREHKEDIEPLVRYFIRKFSLKMKKQINGISREALNIIYVNKWPGNIRQLENAIERAMVIASGARIESSDLDFLDVPDQVANIGFETTEEGLLTVSARAAAEAEKTMIKKILSETKGNKSEAARRLKISYRVMLKKIKDYGLE